MLWLCLTSCRLITNFEWLHPLESSVTLLRILWLYYRYAIDAHGSEIESFNGPSIFKIPMRSEDEMNGIISLSSISGRKLLDLRPKAGARSLQVEISTSAAIRNAYLRLASIPWLLLHAQSLPGITLDRG